MHGASRVFRVFMQEKTKIEQKKSIKNVHLPRIRTNPIKTFIMKKLFLFILSICSWAAMAQSPRDKGLESINIKSIQGPLEFLSSDWMEGRETGQKGAYMASDYLVSMMKVYGLEAFQNDDYLQEFQLLSLKGSEEHLSMINTKVADEEIILEHKIDFDIIGGTTSINAQAEVVFVGYGLKNKEENYNDYKGVNAKGRFVFIVNGYPGHQYPNSELAKKFKPQGYRAARILREQKIANAKEAGARGIILYDPDFTGIQWSENIPFRYEEGYLEADGTFPSYLDKSISLPPKDFEVDIPLIRLNARLANYLTKEGGIDLKNWEEQMSLTAENKSKILDGKELKLSYIVDNELLQARNVTGYIRGKDTTSCIVIGAHYDHYGKYGGFIWNGADDNGSGTIGVLSVARAFQEAGIQPEKNIVFVNFTGEEKGLLGSTYFAEHFPEYMNIDFMINLDMIGRDDKNRDSIGNQSAVIFHKDFPDIKSMYAEITDKEELNLDLLFWPSAGGGGSDHVPFAQKGAPFAFFWTGWHDDYHQPSDEVEKINWKKMRDIIQLVYLSAWEMAIESPETVQE